jgi:hypothetical protein
MKTFHEALLEGFTPVGLDNMVAYWSFKFGPNNEYELCFEPLLFDGQHYVALYENQMLLTEKVVVKPGKTGER